ncbi:MAG: hypothetical protein H7A52_08470 [Akkermansiaceae bacterium]|nr:hypothetical protein [Akkermansiaceae bacterium]
MNPEDYSREDLLSRAVGLPWLVGGLALLAVVWLVTLRWRRRIVTVPALFWFGVARVAIAGCALWLAFQIAGRYLALATAWPLWVLALLGAATMELLIGLYRLEKNLVAPPSRGRWLLGLRLGALAVLLAVLVQPVRSFLVEREIDRVVAVLIDDSMSMDLSDQRLDPSEMLDRAGLFGLGAAANRPPLGAWRRDLESLSEVLGEELAAADSEAGLEAAVETRAETLTQVLNDGAEKAAALADGLDAFQKAFPQLPGNVRNPFAGFRDRLAGPVKNGLAEAARKLAAKDAAGFHAQLASAVEPLRQMTAPLPAAIAEVDRAWFEGLPEPDRKAVAEAAARPRLEIAKNLLKTPLPADPTQQGQVEESTLLDRLGGRYNLRFYRFAHDPREVAKADDLFEAEGAPATAPADASGENSLTDLDAALEHLLDNTAAESLAGVLLLSDGRHNGPTLPEDALRQLGVRRSPLNAVPIGGRLGPVDASILSLNAPESIYLGDRILVKAEVKLDGLRGRPVKAALKAGGETVAEQTIEAPDIDHRTELRFVHFPEDKGIFDYRLELEAMDGELFPDNNAWDFKVAVTDDRTNVLLIDGFPRWEFRYLRNLFYGRDKSVHLQYVLLHPDKIDSLRATAAVAASATRKFGDAEADRLPENADEWRLFDVIILGDVEPAALGNAEWRAIREAVTERGALLVCVAGPRYMPDAHDNEILRDLLPVTWERHEAPRLEAPEAAYRLTLTTEGRGHPLMAQSSSRSLSEQVWAGMPELRWRTVPGGVKEGAEVLAYARPEGPGGRAAAANAADGTPESVEAAIRDLANRKELEKNNALVVTQRAGLGKVVMMNFDQTWRFRYGVGDTFHHRFWGQMMRWGAGGNLRSGNEHVRLGTDRLTYTPSDAVEITGKLLDASRRPVVDAELFAEIYRAGGGERLSRQKMSYRTGSSGLYETSVAALSEPGEYRVRLTGPAVDDALAADPSMEAIETELLVVATRNPVELAELTADRDFLNHAAVTTGGQVFEIGDIAGLPDAFGAPKETLTERRNITLWDKWPLLVLFFGLLTTEWVLRRRGGLA